MKIGITITENAYTPEAYAYEEYLSSRGHSVQLNYVLEPDNDINIYFMGLRPLWQKSIGSAKEIHEYQSLSTPPYSHFKNKVKKVLNKKPDGRIFLNEFVKSDLDFSDTKPFIYRDMGVDEALFQQPDRNPYYDIIYCGSISGRVGLIEVLLSLAKTWRVIIVGNVSDQEKILLQVSNITIVGFVKREHLPEFYRNSRFGLNYTPDVYPYNVQTSTKTLEYLASGLGVISNRYEWSENFFKKIKHDPIWLDTGKVLDKDRLEERVFIDSSFFRKHSWRNVLTNSNLDGFLRDILNEDI